MGYSATCKDPSSSTCPVSTPTIFFLIEKYGRWFFAELFPCEHPRASDGHHQHVILRAPSPVKAGSELMRHDQGSTVVLIAECCTLEDGDADIPDLQSPPPMNRGSGYMSGSETATGVSTVSLARPSRPLVAMITVAAGSTMRR